uniref:ADP-ribosylation factor-binding protein GGA2 n=1 Tax=Plectus sambesii TaxID=2011161 RepID=A0A914VJU0_9BILA
MPEGKMTSTSTTASSPSVGQAGGAQKKTLEYWLTKATDPYISEEERADHISGFCDQINDDLEGPQVACRLLSHKIQSPNEVEALQSLALVDAGVKSCGARFHNEIAKFRFLNELIKILSPKYLGSQTSEKVKQRSIELLYSWQRSLRHLPKLKQAYAMLKEQGVITTDPTYMDEISEPAPPPPPPRVATFEDEEKSKLLAELLKSKSPEDLQAANRLIKSMVKAEDQKLERMTKRGEDLQTAQNNCKLLHEMIGQFRPDNASEQESDLMRELNQALQNLRPTLFRYAGEAAESDEYALAEVLAVNDDVNKTIELFKSRVEPHLGSLIGATPVAAAAAPHSTAQSNAQLLSMMDFDTPAASTAPAYFMSSHLIPASSSRASISSDDVGMIGTSAASTPATVRKSPQSNGNGALADLTDVFGGGPSVSKPTSLSLSQQSMPSRSPPLETPTSSSSAAVKKNSGLEALAELSDVLIKQNLPTGKPWAAEAERQRTKVPMRDLSSTKAGVSLSPLDPFGPTGTPIVASTSTDHGSLAHYKTNTTSQQKNNVLVDFGADCPAEADDDVQSSASTPSDMLPQSLSSVDVQLSDIKPSSRLPLVVVDRGGIKVVLHYAANRPRADVLTTVISISSSSTTPVTGISFEARPVSSEVAIKQLEQSADSLPAYNPIFPQQAVTSILLIASSGPAAKTMLDYTLAYSASSDFSVSGSFEVLLHE